MFNIFFAKIRSRMAPLLLCASAIALRGDQSSKTYISHLSAEMEMALEARSASRVEKIVTLTHAHAIDLDDLRVGKYNDTPLAAALRLYGNQLQQRTQENPAASLGILSMAASSITGFALYAWKLRHGEHEQSAITTSNFVAVGTWPLYFFGFLFLKTLPKNSTVRIINVLVQHQHNILARNYEGITPVDIARAYEPYAQALHDEWYLKLVDRLVETSLIQAQRQRESIMLRITVKSS